MVDVTPRNGAEVPNRDHSPEPISIRAAHAGDAQAIRRLAALDSAPAPASPLLVAETRGEIRAAMSLTDGAVVADPFSRTAGLIVLLGVHAQELREVAGDSRPRARGRRVAATVARALAPRERDTTLGTRRTVAYGAQMPHVLVPPR
jgi:hypothetical protein